MFVDRFSDEEAIEIAKRYCVMTDDPVNKYNIEDYMTKKNMVRDEGEISFWFEYYSHEEDRVTLSDFGFVNGFIWACNEDMAQRDYLKFMYRRFGKEYLDALDEYHRMPIVNKYNKEISKHEAMIKDVMGEE